MEAINPVNKLLWRPSNIWSHCLEHLYVELQISNYLPWQINLHLWFVEKCYIFYSMEEVILSQPDSSYALLLKVLDKKVKLKQVVETYLSTQYVEASICIKPNIVCALWIILAAYLPPNGIPILQLQNKFSVLLWMLGSRDK